MNEDSKTNTSVTSQLCRSFKECVLKIDRSQASLVRSQPFSTKLGPCWLVGEEVAEVAEVGEEALLRSAFFGVCKQLHPLLRPQL